MPIVVEFAGIPPAKGRVRATRSGIMYTPAATRRNEAALRYAAQQVMGDRPPPEGALAVTITATFPIPTSWSRRKQQAALEGKQHHTGRPDADNLLKSIDSLNGVVRRDDAQICRAEIIKQYGERPNMRIEIRQADEPKPGFSIERIRAALAEMEDTGKASIANIKGHRNEAA
jgi:Holliday junction resolvase RusA-like endonuclease